MNKKTESLETIAVIHCVHEDIPRTVALIEVDPLLTDRIKIEMAYELTRSIENMMPWERDVYVGLLIEWIKDEEERNKEQSRG
jgi:hypothetical protein